MIFLHSLLLSIALRASAEGLHADHQSNQPAAMTMGAQSAQSDISPVSQTTNQTLKTPPPCFCPALDLSALSQEQQQVVQWRKEVLVLLSQLVSGQKEVAGGQTEGAKLLGTLVTQGSQQILDLQNLARHQSLLVENHQALLLQTSRIAAQLQEIGKKPASQ